MVGGKTIPIASCGQSWRQEPQCQHSSGYLTYGTSLPSSSSLEKMASAGHSSSHKPQPTHLSLLKIGGMTFPPFLLPRYQHLTTPIPIVRCRIIQPVAIGPAFSIAEIRAQPAAAELAPARSRLRYSDHDESHQQHGGGRNDQGSR